MIKQYELVGMSCSFLGYVFRDPLIGKIKRVFLFGSVARNDFDEESDVDLFFDVEKKEENIVKKRIEFVLKRFYASSEFQKFRLKGITNEIKPNVGCLEEWELKKQSKERESCYSPPRQLQR